MLKFIFGCALIAFGCLLLADVFFGATFGLVGGIFGAIVGLIGGVFGLIGALVGAVVGVLGLFLPILIIGLILLGILKLLSLA